MTLDEWFAKGQADRALGALRRLSPDEERGTEIGDAWRSGWDAADSELLDRDVVPGEVIEVALRWSALEKSWYLVDGHRRVIGHQREVHMSQGEDGKPLVTVVFEGAEPI